MRPTALTAPRPPRPQHHRAAVITLRSRPGPAPRPQRTATTRTHQLTVGEPFLDSGSVGPYREHRASARDTALPDAHGQETPGGPFVCPHRHGAAAYQQHTQPSTHQDPSAPTMPGNRPPRRIPQRRSTHRVVRCRPGRRRDRHREDPAALSAGELLRRTLRADARTILLDRILIFEQPRVFRTGFLLVLCYFLAVQPSVVNFLRCAVSES